MANNKKDNNDTVTLEMEGVGTPEKGSTSGKGKFSRKPEELFDVSSLEGEMELANRLTHVPKFIRDAFKAHGYELQYVNSNNLSEWNRMMALTNGAIQAVTGPIIEQICGQGQSLGLALEKTAIGGKVEAGVVRAGEMVLMMIPTSVVALKTKQNKERTMRAREAVYGRVNPGRAERFRNSEFGGDDKAPVIQTVVRGDGADPFLKAEAYFGD